MGKGAKGSYQAERRIAMAPKKKGARVERTLTRRHLALTEFADKNGNRPVLTGVYVDPKAGVAVAADGWMLLQMPLGKMDPQDYPPTSGAGKVGMKEGIIPASAVAAAVKGLPKRNTLPVLQNIRVTGDGNGKACLTTNDLEQARDSWVSLIEGTFPSYRQLMPKKLKRGNKKAREVTLSRDLLARLVRAMGEMGADRVHLQITAFDHPVRVDIPYEDGEAQGCLMPMFTREG